MSANTFGQKFRVTSFGESHGPALGVVIDGCPAGVLFDTKLLSRELKRRRPGSWSQNSLQSDRQEPDQPEVLSGVFEGKTLGTPITIIVKNRDVRSGDYDQIKTTPRPGHADDVWKKKFLHTDHRGGGRSSGRETLSRVIAGSIARMILQQLTPQTTLFAFSSQIGPFSLSKSERDEIIHSSNPLEVIDSSPARFPKNTDEVQSLLLEAKEQGKSYGGTAEVWVNHPPPSLGQPVFHKLKADLALAAMSIGATCGFELGDGFQLTQTEGSQLHKEQKSGVQNAYGGIRGGITTGEPIFFRVGFKPTSSVLDIAKSGRHDPCIVPRAIPVLEAMTALILVDHLLWSKTDHIDGL